MMTGEATQVKFSDLQGKSIYEGRFIDRSPQCLAAGKLSAGGDTTEVCLRPKTIRPPTPDVIRKFRASFQPDAGQTRVFYGRAYDPQRHWAADMLHGVSTKSSSSVKEVVSPALKTLYQQTFLDRKEKNYRHNTSAPLGRCHDQSIGLPRGLDVNTFTFGVPTSLDIGAGGLVNPNKNFDTVFRDASEGHENYVKSHMSFYPMERVCRGYTSPSFHPQKRFGLPTPHCNDGSQTREIMKNIDETMADRATKIVSKRVDDYREKTQHQLGKSLDPIKDTMRVPEDHTFGILDKPDPYGAGDIIHYRKMTNVQRGRDSRRAVVAAVRQQLKKLNYQHFPNLLEAFRFYDQEGRGKITLQNLRNVCIKYQLPVDHNMIEAVLDYCDLDKDGMISYIEFANFLNWKENMPTGLENPGPPPMLIGASTAVQNKLDTHPPKKLIEEEDLVVKTPYKTDASVRTMEKQLDFSVGGHSTSNAMYNAVIGPGGISSRNFRTYGVPTIRSDLPAPRARKVHDTRNYGDETHLYGLMCPSIYSQHNVYERELMTHRTFEEIRSIFNNIGVRMAGDEYERIYKMAADSHPNGVVSVQAFRKLLDSMQSEQIRQGNHPLCIGERD